MALISKPTMGSDKPRQLPPAGNHVARCFSIVDLGIQDRPDFQGKPKPPAPQLRFTWELPTKKAVFNPEKGEQPFTVSSKDLNISTDDRSGLRKLVEQWIGRSYTKDEIENTGFDIPSLLGQPCLLNIAHVPGEGKHLGKTFVEIKSISPLPEGFQCPDQINQSFMFDVSMGPNSAAFQALPKFIQDKVLKCHEWRTPAAPHTDAALAHDDGEIDENPY
jgi:hypothetical protein